MPDPFSPAHQRAVTLARFGGPEVLHLAERPWPQPVDDEVLVRVRAASVNPVDLKTRAGQFPAVGEDALPIVLGRESLCSRRCVEIVAQRKPDLATQASRILASQH